MVSYSRAVSASFLGSTGEPGGELVLSCQCIIFRARSSLVWIVTFSLHPSHRGLKRNEYMKLCKKEQVPATPRPFPDFYAFQISRTVLKFAVVTKISSQSCISANSGPLLVCRNRDISNFGNEDGSRKRSD